MNHLLAVTALVRDWIKRSNAGGESFQAIAERLGVSKTQVLHVRDGIRNVGPEMEANFAALQYGGSVDDLRRAAHSAYEADRESIDKYPNRAEAADICERSRIISKEAIRSVLADPPPPVDLSTIQWIDRIRLREGELKSAASSEAAPRNRPRKRR